MAEYSKMISGQVISVGGATAVTVPFTPDFIEISNRTSIQGTNSGVSRAWWETDMGQGAAFLTTTASATDDLTSYIDALGGSGSTTGNTAGTGFKTVDGALALQYGPVYQHTSTQDFTLVASTGTALVTTTTPHNLVSGNVVIFQNLYQTPTTGMPQICGIPFKVTVGSATAFRINWDPSGSNYTSFNTATSTGNIGSFKQILFPNLYSPGRAIVAISPTATTGPNLLQQTLIFTTADHNFVVGQAVAFNIPEIWGLDQLNSLPDGRVPGSSKYAYVTDVISAFAFVVDIDPATITTPFNPNVPVSKVPGLSFPQIVAVGDQNTGSTYFGFQSPNVTKAIGNGVVSTNGGPTVDGSYLNATYRAFIIGPAIAGNNNDVIYWTAYASDINS